MSKEPFHKRVQDWVIDCFGPQTAADLPERNARFLEESLELVQANGVTHSQVMEVFNHVYNRPPGVLEQEVGGVMTALASLCVAYKLHMQELGEAELTRVLTLKDAIRDENKTKARLLTNEGQNHASSKEG